MEGDKNRDADVRVDKWLWAARFFKTRSLAAEAVSGGKIQINGERAKPSRVVRSGRRSLTSLAGPPRKIDALSKGLRNEAGLSARVISIRH